jgi:hypothetical protein
MIEIKGVTKVIKKKQENEHWVIKQLSYDENFIITGCEPVPEKSWDELQERLKRQREECKNTATS